MTAPNKRVLVVDNNEEEGRLFVSMFEQAGYDAMATWSGLEALNLMQHKTFDLLLVSDYLADLYVGDFLKRLDLLPNRPCSLVVRRNQSPTAEFLRIKSLVPPDASAPNY